VAPPELENAIRREDRARIVTTRDGNLATALGCALADLPCDRVLMLSPDDELAEHALGLIAQGKARSVATEVKALARTIPERLLTAINVLKWTASATPLENASGEVVVQPLDAAQALAFRVPPPVQALSLHFSANFVGISGWDAVGFQMLRGLASRGVRVLAHPAAIVKPHVVPPAVAFPVMPRSPSQPQLIVAAPFQVKPFAPDEHTAIFTMWECDRLATADVAVLNRAKVVIVPTAWGRDTFRASGVTVPIEVVPLGMDPLTYFPSGDTPSITTFGVAGALGAGGIRKNLAAAVDAFRAAFPTETNVKLRVKITPDCPPLDWPHDDRIDITRAVLPPAQVAAWYRSLTAFVNPSKAEGFGLHGLEAIACGVPLISTAATGVAEYFDATVGVVVPHTAEAVHNDYYRGQWFPPSVDGLADAMRRVFTDGTGAMGDAAAARARTFTWRNSVRTLHAVLAKHDLLEAA
jgi:glycosyltransferase involved in cell wall biosynthesis